MRALRLDPDHPERGPTGDGDGGGRGGGGGAPPAGSPPPPEQLVVVVDDDTLYPTRLVEVR